MIPNKSVFLASGWSEKKEYPRPAGFQGAVLATPVRPPNLHLAECCCRCKYALTEGMSIECKKFIARSISSYAVCDAYEEPDRNL